MLANPPSILKPDTPQEQLKNQSSGFSTESFAISSAAAELVVIDTDAMELIVSVIPKAREIWSSGRPCTRISRSRRRRSLASAFSFRACPKKMSTDLEYNTRRHTRSSLSSLLSCGPESWYPRVLRGSSS